MSSCLGVWGGVGSVNIERLLPTLAQTLHSCDCLPSMESKAPISIIWYRICSWNNAASGLKIRFHITAKLVLQV